MSQRAVLEKCDPYEYCTRVSDSFRDCFSHFSLDYDYFIRTTDSAHKANVTEIWNKMRDNGSIYLGKYNGWYSISDETFVTDTNVTNGVDKAGKPCKVNTESMQPVEWVSEDNYKFKLSQYQDVLLSHYMKNPKSIIPEHRRQEVISFIKGGLMDISVSRKKSSCDWGIDVPNEPNHIIYVWLDALSNYFTASRLDFPESNKDIRVATLLNCSRTMLICGLQMCT